MFYDLVNPFPIAAQQSPSTLAYMQRRQHEDMLRQGFQQMMAGRSQSLLGQEAGLFGSMAGAGAHGSGLRFPNLLTSGPSKAMSGPVHLAAQAGGSATSIASYQAPGMLGQIGGAIGKIAGPASLALGAYQGLSGLGGDPYGAAAGVPGAVPQLAQSYARGAGLGLAGAGLAGATFGPVGLAAGMLAAAPQLKAAAQNQEGRKELAARTASITGGSDPSGLAGFLYSGRGKIRKAAKGARRVVKKAGRAIGL